MAELANVQLIPWTEYRRQVEWRNTDSDGFRIAIGPSIEACGLSARIMRLPPGPAGSGSYLNCPSDRIWLQVRGETRLGIGETDFQLSARDLAYLPATERLTLMANGDGEAIGLEVTIDANGSELGPDQPAAFAHRWDDYAPRVTWDLPLARQWGYARGSFPPISIPNAWAHLMRHLPGQSAPVHSVPTDLIFIGLDEVAEFEILGSTYHLGPYDLMVVPADTPYKYTNYGFSEALFLDVGLSATAGRRWRYFIDDGGHDGAEPNQQ